MNTILQINARGTLTLPKFVRKALGVGGGGVVMLDFRDNAVVLQPAVAFPIEMYTDARIAEFDEADAELGKRMAKKGRSREAIP